MCVCTVYARLALYATVVAEYGAPRSLRDARDRTTGVPCRVWHQQQGIRLNGSGGLWRRRSPLRFGSVAQTGTHVLRATGHGIALRQSPGWRLRRRRRDVPKEEATLHHTHASLPRAMRQESNTYLRGQEGDACSIKFLLRASGDSPRLNLGGGSGDGARSLPSLRRT